VLNKRIEPPFKPKITGGKDLRHFDPMFTEEPVVDTPILTQFSKVDEYEKFTYQKYFLIISPIEIKRN
jgi:hypothetical protein